MPSDLALTRICARYAQAASTLVPSDDARRKLDDDARAMAMVLDASAPLRRTIANPGTPASALRHIFSFVKSPAPKGIGAGAPFAQLIELLISRRRIALLDPVVKAVRQRIMQLRRIVEVEITTARRLDDAMRDRVRRSLAQSIPDGANLKLEEKIRPDIFGGIMIATKSHLYDDSLLGRAHRLRTLMKGTS